MQNSDSTARRTVVRVEDKIHLGADSQVDDRNVLITPVNPAATDPFLLLSEDWFSTPGFEWHPHRGLETVTLVLDGVLEHGDNLGNAGALTAGDIQWMTAGRGIIHRELAFRNERAHTLQLWVNLPGELKMTGTRYQDLRAADRPVIERDGARIGLISGDVGGTSGPALNYWPITGTLITLTAGHGDQPSLVMVYSGQPIGQPVAMGGPFVMNNQAEIAQAFNDFHSGKFGDIPQQARLKYR
jgi:redox-sensitive bicupin YhaK (pirin superfamily)